MKRLLLILLVLTMVFTLFLSMGTVASANETQQNYTLILKGGVAYEGSIDENNIISPSGLTYDNTKGEWTMNNFVFSTSAPVGIEIKDEGNVTINISGTNSITAGISATSKSIGMKAAVSKEGTGGTYLTFKGDSTNDKLTVDSHADPKIGNTGIQTYSLSADAVTLDVLAGYKTSGAGSSSVGISASAIAINDSIVSVTALDYQSNAIDYIEFFDVKGSSIVTATSDESVVYASKMNSEVQSPNAIAKAGETTLEWFSELIEDENEQEEIVSAGIGYYLKPGTDDDDFTGTLTMTAIVCEITECTSSTNLKGKQYGSVADALAAADTNTSTIKLKGNVTENVTINENQNIILDLNGHVLKGDGVESTNESRNHSVINNEGTLTIKDTATSNNIHYFKVDDTSLWVLDDTQTTANYTFDTVDGLKTVSDNKAYTGFLEANKVIKVTGGCITNGTGTYLTTGTAPVGYPGAYGGAVLNNKSLILSDINIIGNNCTYGGGVANIGSTANAEVKGCGLFGNTVKTSGGGVYNISGRFAVDNAFISYNTANLGGGVYNDSESPFNGAFYAQNTTISYNTAKMSCGGVYNYSGTITVGGATKIINNVRNTDSEAFTDNLRLSGQYLTIGNGENGCPVPDNNMKIGVCLTGKGGPRPGEFTTNGEVSDVNYFLSDSDSYVVRYVAPVGTEGEAGYKAGHLELTNEIIEATTGTTAKYYTSILNALKHGEASTSAVPTGETASEPTCIKLLTNVTEKVEIPSSRNITLDLAGKTLSSEGTAIFNEGNLTIKDSSSEHIGKINAMGDGGTFVSAITNEKTLSVTGGTILAYGEDENQNVYSIYGKNANTEIDGEYTQIIATGTEDCNSIEAVYMEAGGETTIKAGTFKGTGAVNGVAGSEINILGGKFDGALAISSNKDLKISGGWFSKNPTNYVIEGYVAKNLTTDKLPYRYEVKPLKVCKIGNAEYSSIEAALKHGGTDTTTKDPSTGESDTVSTTIVLIDDDTENVTIPAERNITLDLNGFVLKAKSNGSVITNKGKLTIIDSDTTATTHKVRYFTDGKCSHGKEIGYTCISCGGSGKADGCYETFTTEQPSSMIGVLKVIGGCITGGTGTLDNAASFGGGIYSTGILYLQGGTIIGNSCNEEGGGVYIKGGSMEMLSVTICGNLGDQYGGGLCIANGNATMKSGTITYNTANTGGGVAVRGGSFTMEGGTISQNAAEFGGGVAIEEDEEAAKEASFTLTKGTISYNTAKFDDGASGGGVYLAGGNFTMTSGSICNNTSECISNEEAYAYGGGICNLAGTMVLSGGSITNNTAKCTVIGGVCMGSGIFANEDTDTTLGGNVRIIGNSNDNLYLKDGQNVTINTNGLKENARIGVTLETSYGQFTSNGATTDVKYFISDNELYTVNFVKGDTTKESSHPLYNDHLELVTAYSVTEETCTNGSISVGATKKYAEGNEVTISNTPESGYELDEYSVYKTGEQETVVSVTDGKFTMPGYNVTVSATFKKKQSSTPAVVYYNPTQTFTVPVSGNESTVKIQAELSENTAKVKEIKESDLKTVGTEKQVVIDLSEVKDSVDAAVITKSSLKNVVDSGANGIKFIMPDGTVAEFDKTAIKAILDQAQGDDIKLVIDRNEKAEQTLTSDQKTTLETMNNPSVIDAYFVSGGKRISDFNGGTATVTAEYKSEYPVRIWYLMNDGEKEAVPSEYDKEKQLATFDVNHFSHYVAEQIEEASEEINKVSEVKIRVYSKYVRVNGKRYIKPYIKVLKGQDTLDTLKDAGYTFKYVFYRSTSTKTSSFKKLYTTKNQNFTDKKGTNGKYYYYKAKLMIYDENGELVTSTKLSQCKYGCRLYNEKSKNMN